MVRKCWSVTACLAAAASGLWLLTHALAEPVLPAPDASATASDAEPIDVQTLENMSYALGLSIGRDLRASQVRLDLKPLSAGLADGVSGAQSRLSEEALRSAMQQFQQLMRTQAEVQSRQIASVHQKQAATFLAENRQQQGVVETASGLQYKVLRQGNGPSPTLTDQVKTHYAGKLLDGTEFDSSYRRGEPAVFPVGGVIKGWTEALQKMQVGDKWQLWVPSNLAYANEPPGPPIQPGHLLVFEIELLGIAD